MTQFARWKRSHKILFGYTFCCLLTLWAHQPFVDASPFLTNSDYSVFALGGQDFAAGRWSAFYYQQDYGGTLLAVVRAAFLAIGSWLGLAHGIFDANASFVFSYMMTPLLMTSGAFFLALSYGTIFSAFCVGLICALGHPYWLTLYGNDFYFAAILIAGALLGWRGRLNNPWTQCSGWQLFWAGLFSGFGVYTWRATLIYGVAFFLPPGLISTVWNRCVSPRDRIERWARGAICVFLFLYGYLQLFGGQLGTWNGKMVKLHAGPNLYFLGFCLPLLFLREIKKSCNSVFLKKGALILAGFFVGLIPEIIFKLNNQSSLRQVTSWETLTSFEESIQLLIFSFPNALRELSIGEKGYDFSGIVRNAPIVLTVLALGSLVVASKKERKLIPALVSAVLSVIAFIEIKTYVAGISHYLFPIFPAIIVGLSLVFSAKSKGSWVRILVLALLGFQLLYQFQFREQLLAMAEKSGETQRHTQISQLFKKARVDVVISNDFWDANTLTLMSERRPYFVSSGRPWGPPQGFEQVRSSKRIGVLVGPGREADGEPRPNTPEGVLQKFNQSREFWHSEDSSFWKVEFLAKVGPSSLFLVTR